MGWFGVLFSFSLAAAVTGVKQYLFTDSGKEHCIVRLEETDYFIFYLQPRQDLYAPRWLPSRTGNGIQRQLELGSSFAYLY